MARGQRCHMGTIQLSVSVVTFIWYNCTSFEQLTKKPYMIFLQKSLDCIYDHAKAWIYACIGLRWFCEDQIQWIRIHPQHVSKIVTLYFDFMLNLTDINNYLFLFFFKKNRAYKHYVYKGGEPPPPIGKIKWWCAPTIHATSNLQVPRTVDTTCASTWGSSGDTQKIPNG